MLPPPTDALLLAALRDTPRRHGLPPLPASLAAAQAAPADVALATVLEAVRRGERSAALRELFMQALATLVREALAPDTGDAAFQALVLRAQDADVAEHVRLGAQAAADRRTVRSAVDALAHPGKTVLLPAGETRSRLEQLHALARDAHWPALQAQARQDGLDTLAGHDALQRLVRAAALRTRDGVQRYLRLCEQRGPLAGSDAAAAQGRAAARMGAQAEQATVQAFRAIAALLGEAYTVVRSLRMPRGFPGAAGKAKDEWDAAIARRTEGALHLVVLAEVKAAPAAATTDLWRLLRGLQRLALAAPGTRHVFPSADGDVTLAGDALRALAPQGDLLPPQVVYCCAGPEEAEPQLLSPASKAVLLAEPASLALAQRLARGEATDAASLLPVWEALPAEPRLRSALHQDATARAVRAAMLHPQDLLAAVQRRVDGSR